MNCSESDDMKNAALEEVISDIDALSNQEQAAYYRSVLRKEVDINHICQYTGTTIQSTAVTHGHVRIAEYLLGLGASIDIQYEGQPVFLLNTQNYAMCKVLLPYLPNDGKFVNRYRDDDGKYQQLLYCTAGHLDLVKMLVETYNADISLCDIYRQDATMCAAEAGHTDIVEYLDSRKRSCKEK